MCRSVLFGKSLTEVFEEDKEQVRSVAMPARPVPEYWNADDGEAPEHRGTHMGTWAV